jgi:hypothetical protein
VAPLPLLFQSFFQCSCWFISIFFSMNHILISTLLNIRCYNLWLNHKFSPGIDFPNSKYSCTDGLKNPVGITTGSSRSSSNRWLGSDRNTGDDGALLLLARFDRFVCPRRDCCSRQSVIVKKKTHISLQTCTLTLNFFLKCHHRTY